MLSNGCATTNDLMFRLIVLMFLFCFICVLFGAAVGFGVYKFKSTSEKERLQKKERGVTLDLAREN